MLTCTNFLVLNSEPSSKSDCMFTCQTQLSANQLLLSLGFKNRPTCHGNITKLLSTLEEITLICLNQETHSVPTCNKEQFTCIMVDLINMTSISKLIQLRVLKHRH